MSLDTAIATYGPGADVLQPARHPQDARRANGQFVASQTLTKGTVLGIVTASKKLTAYASGNADGSQTPVGVLEYSIVVNSDGSIVFGTNVTVDEWGSTTLLAPYFEGGDFAMGDLTGCDANAISKLGRIVEGDSSTGILRIS